MAEFRTTINLSPETVKALKQQGYSLYGFKAVEAAGTGAPTVWFKLAKEKLLTQTDIIWQEKYEGYNSTEQIEPNVTIRASNPTSADLGDLITIEEGSGNLKVTKDGYPHAISFLNNDTQQFTVGIKQVVDNSSNILCAFPILGSGASRVITPLTKIALIFSTAKILTSTVITKAMSSGALIDLTGVESRSVQFGLNEGWTAGNAPWMTRFNAFTSMPSLLIESPSPVEKDLSERALEYA